MGLIKAALGAAGGVMADQWKEYFYCEALPANILAVKGQKRAGSRSSNTKGSDNIITNGSIIAVADGQCMLIVEQGKVVDVCAEPGEYTYYTSTEPSIFAGGLNKDNIMRVLATVGKRFTFGGEAPKDQRVYYFNTKELIGNKYGTPSPVPFPVVDQRAGIDIDIAIRCFGEYSYRVSNPLLFYTNVCGNVESGYDRGQLDSQLKTELLTAMQPAFARISEMGIRYSPHAGAGGGAQRRAVGQVARSARTGDRLFRRIVGEGLGRRRADDQGDAAQRRVHGPDESRRTPGRRAGQRDAVRRAESGRRPGDGLYGYEHGGPDGRHERAEPVPDGSAAAAGAAAHARTGPCSARCKQLDVSRLRRDGHGQILPRMRREKARAEGCRRLEVPQVRRDCYRQVLPRVRRKEARTQAGRLGVQLRRGEQG